MYRKDDPFKDPVVRCDSCKQLLFLADLKKSGKCECGNRKVREVLALSFWEFVKMKWRSVDPEYLKIFGIPKYWKLVSFITLFKGIA